jgi:hypothetical protein
MRTPALFLKYSEVFEDEDALHGHVTRGRPGLRFVILTR